MGLLVLGVCLYSNTLSLVTYIYYIMYFSFDIRNIGYRLLLTRNESTRVFVYLKFLVKIGFKKIL